VDIFDNNVVNINVKPWNLTTYLPSRKKVVEERKYEK